MLTSGARRESRGTAFIRLTKPMPVARAFQTTGNCWFARRRAQAQPPKLVIHNNFSTTALALTVLALLHYQPLHPYGIQRLIKQWGKDQVVNVEQRTSLYRTIERLLAAGLIAVRETGRDPRYPERTVYEVTEAGRQTARRWLEEMLAEPRQEYPEFPAALSHVLMLEPAELAEVLERRAQRLAAMLAALDANTAAEAGHGLPRIAMLENEYQRAVLAAEARWVAETVTELRSGQLTWSPDELIAFAEGH
jgi:DNA-binding PadR family transcriptional regulator